MIIILIIINIYVIIKTVLLLLLNLKYWLHYAKIMIFYLWHFQRSKYRNQINFDRPGNYSGTWHLLDRIFKFFTWRTGCQFDNKARCDFRTTEVFHSIRGWFVQFHIVFSATVLLECFLSVTKTGSHLLATLARSQLLIRRMNPILIQQQWV